MIPGTDTARCKSSHEGRWLDAGMGTGRYERAQTTLLEMLPTPSQKPSMTP